MVRKDFEVEDEVGGGSGLMLEGENRCRRWYGRKRSKWRF